MFCPNCGSQVQDGSNFCVNCGSALNGRHQQPRQQAPAKKKGNIWLNLAVIAAVFLLARFVLAPMMLSDPEAAARETAAATRENASQKKASDLSQKVFKGTDSSGTNYTFSVFYYEQDYASDYGVNYKADGVTAIWTDISTPMPNASQADHDAIQANCDVVHEAAAYYGLGSTDYISQYTYSEDMGIVQIYVLSLGDGINESNELAFVEAMLGITAAGDTLTISDVEASLFAQGLALSASY